MRFSKSQPGTGRLSRNRSDPKDAGRGIVYRSLPAQIFRIGDGEEDIMYLSRAFVCIFSAG